MWPLLLAIGCTDGGETGVAGDLDTAEVVGDSAADTGDIDAPDVECGEIPPDDAGYADLFDATRVHEVALSLSAEARASLEADPRGWVDASLVVDGRSFPTVGVKWRGSSEQQRWDGKPGFKIGLRERGSCDTLAGIETLTLDAMADDSAMGRWVVAAEVLEALGLPTARATYATVTVDGEPFGLYAHAETVDGAFAGRRWPGEAGVLWEGGDGADFGGGGLDAWDDVSGEGDEATLEAVATVVRASGDDAFYADADALVDMEQLLATWAALAAIGHADSYPYEPDHVYLFAPASDARFRFVAWAPDAGWDPAFGWDHVEGLLGLRCLYDATCAAALDGAMDAALESVEALDVPARAEAAFAVSAAVVAVEERHPTAPADVLAARGALRETMLGWAEAVRAQRP